MNLQQLAEAAALPKEQMDQLAIAADQYSAQPGGGQSDYAFGKTIGAYNGYIAGYLAGFSSREEAFESLKTRVKVLEDALQSIINDAPDKLERSRHGDVAEDTENVTRYYIAQRARRALNP